MAARMYYDQDADLGEFQGKRVAIIGYGSQGHAHALNLRESGVDVIVANRPGSANYRQAVADGFKPVSAAEAAEQADLMALLVPDEAAPKVYANDLVPHLREGKTLLFSHGFNVHFHQIEAPGGVDVIMIAPKSPGHLVRRMYEDGKGVPALIAIHQDASGRATRTGLAYAKGIGCTRAGVLETTFEEETETDLFGEQVVLCGGVTELIRGGFDTLVEAGYQPEVAYFECLHELKLIVDLIYEGGISWMRHSISDTAEYGDLTRGRRVVDSNVRQEMKRILQEIQSGAFAREWILENQAGRAQYHARKAKDAAHLIEQVGKELRAMMPWIKGPKTAPAQEAAAPAKR